MKRQWEEGEAGRLAGEDPQKGGSPQGGVVLGAQYTTVYAYQCKSQLCNPRAVCLWAVDLTEPPGLLHWKMRVILTSILPCSDKDEMNFNIFINTYVNI